MTIFLAFCFCFSEPTPWQAGAAAQVITPPRPMWLSGYAARTKPSTGKINDLYVKALVLIDPEGQKLLLLTFDLVGIDRETSQRIVSAIQKQCPISRDRVVFNFSHTHSGPVVGTNLRTIYPLDAVESQKVKDYTDFLIAQCATVVEQATKNITPARISYAEGIANFAVNRRNNAEPKIDEIRKAGKLQGPVDHRVPVFHIQRQNATNVVVFGYACHATVLSGYEWCGDYPGFAQADLEKQLPNTQAMFVAGCGGDQNPLPRRSLELARNYGKQLASAVLAALPKTAPVNGSSVAFYQEVPLAFDLDSQIPVKGNSASKPTHYPYPIQLWKIGNRTIHFLGGEVVVDYALRVQKELGANHWVAGYCNDVMAYIPNQRILKEGGYEGRTSMSAYGIARVWSNQVEEQVMTTVHQWAALSETEKPRSPPAKPASVQDHTAYRGQVLAGMQRVMGTLPPHPCMQTVPVEILHREKIGTIERQQIRYSTADGDKVPAYLFLPTKGPAPAVLCLHQTTSIGKSEPAGLGGLPTLHYARELAERGFVTLAPDYPNFGGYKIDVYKAGYASATMKGIVNHRTAIDLLQQLPQVIPDRIGVIGHSLGGHNALFLAAFDSRVQVTVTSCGFNAFTHYYQGNLKGWSHQGYMPRIRDRYHCSPAEMPFDFPDVLAAIAPRAVYIHAPLRDDNFAAAGVRLCVNHATPYYQLYDALSKLQANYPDCQHEFPDAVRQQACAFLEGQLKPTR